MIPDDILAGEEMSREHAEMHKQPHVNFYDQAIRFDLVGAKTEEQVSLSNFVLLANQLLC